VEVREPLDRRGSLALTAKRVAEPYQDHVLCDVSPINLSKRFATRFAVFCATFRDASTGSADSARGSIPSPTCGLVARRLSVLEVLANKHNLAYR